MTLNVLIVDDSRTARAVIAKTLGLAELPVSEVYEAADGARGLAVLACTWIDLVFTDLHMPVMDGLEMVRQMSEDGVLATIPVIVISSDGSTKRLEQLRAHGIAGYIRKPLNPETLRDLAISVLEPSNGS